MTDNYASPLSLQIAPDGGAGGEASLPGRGVSPHPSFSDVPPQAASDVEEGHLTAQKYIQDDKETLAHLLKLTLAQGQTLNLDTNEELPRLIPILCSYFSSEELIQLTGEKTAAKILDMHRTEVLQNLFLESELRNVLHAFNEAEIPLMLFKGPALAYTIYPQANLRTYHDIDALIHPDDLERAGDLLTGMEYSFYNEYRADAVDEQRTGYHYVLERPDSWLSVLIELHTAPHSSEIGSLFDREALWVRAKMITVLGEPTLTMDPADHLLYLCWHYRFHGFTRLLWLYDIVMLLRTFGEQLDWVGLVCTAHRQQMAATLYYCLSWCRDLFGVVVPERVFIQLRPPLASRLIVERITMPDPAWALAAAQGQQRRLIARRAMVDSKGGLLRAGLRTLFPSPTAMKKRYMERLRLPLQLFFLFYPIHPCITLAKGCYYFLRRRTKGKKR